MGEADEKLVRVVIRSACCDSDITVTVGETFEQCTYACTKCGADKPNMWKKEVVMEACPPKPLEDFSNRETNQIECQPGQ